MSACCDFCGMSISEEGAKIYEGIKRGIFTSHICTGCAQKAIDSFERKKNTVPVMDENGDIVQCYKK